MVYSASFVNSLSNGSNNTSQSRSTDRSLNNEVLEEINQKVNKLSVQMENIQPHLVSTAQIAHIVSAQAQMAAKQESDYNSLRSKIQLIAESFKGVNDKLNHLINQSSMIQGHSTFLDPNHDSEETF